MFGETAISSSESLAAAGSSLNLSPDPDCAVPQAFFSFRDLWPGEGSLPVGRSLFRPHETKAVRGSLANIACEGGGAHCSTIMQSRTGAREIYDTKAFPLSEVFVRSGVLILSGVLALFGVLERSDALPRFGFGDCPRPDRTDYFVLFFRTWDERVRSSTEVFARSGSLPDSAGWEVPAG